MGGITVTRRRQGGGPPGPPRFNGPGVAALIKALVPGGIVERTGRGIDMHGRQFAAYSRRYLRQLRRMGEDPKVDLRLSGGLMNSIKARGADITDNRVVVTVAPDTGTSPQYRAPSERRALRQAGLVEGRFGQQAVYRTLTRKEGKALQKSLAYEQAGARRIDTGRRGPQHNILAHYLHYGTAKIKARPFLGLTPEQTKSLFDAIRKIMWR